MIIRKKAQREKVLLVKISFLCIFCKWWSLVTANVRLTSKYVLKYLLPWNKIVYNASGKTLDVVGHGELKLNYYITKNRLLIGILYLML